MPDTPEQSLLVLKQQRSSIKGQITKFQNYVYGFKSENATNLQNRELQLKLSKFEELSSKFEDIQSQIETLVLPDDLEVEIEERDQIETKMCNLIAAAGLILNPIEENTGSSSHSTSRSRSDTAAFGDEVKLPTINLPKFDGDHLKWLEFRDMFESLIHKSERITPMSKFHYLRSSLVGGAAVAVNSISFTADNYNLAWDMLCERFNNKRILINNHLKSLHNFETITKESHVSLRLMIDHISKNLHALNILGEPTDHWDTLIIFSMSSKLDSVTGCKWEEHRSTLSTSVTLKDFYQFLRDRADVLETRQLSKGVTNSTQRMPPAKQFGIKQTKSLHVASTNESTYKLECAMCRQEHRLEYCPGFKAMTPESRFETVKRLKLCSNCFRPGHHQSRCRKSPCTICNRKHNTLVHFQQNSSNNNGGHVNNNNENNHSNSNNLNTNRNDVQTGTKSNLPNPSVHVAASLCGEVLLCTAIVEVITPNHTYQARALLDSGSQSSFVTEKIKNSLNLPVSNTNTVTICGVNENNFNISQRCEIKIKSRLNKYSTTVSCLVIQKITGSLPNAEVDYSKLSLPENIELADPNFFRPSDIDLLLGADVFWDLVETNRVKLGKNKPTLTLSKLGWLISGPVGECTQNSEKKIKCNFSQEIKDRLAMFWELEELPVTNKLLSSDEEFCENHYLNNFSRLPDGRFSVKIPLRATPEESLGDSYSAAKRRFFNLERKLQSKPYLKQMYADFIHEYEQLGHLTKIPRPDFGYYLPHHAVTREQSETTKLRVVFDASCKSSSTKSLNDLQVVGPVVQDDLFSILVRFRQNSFVVTGDIEKMYRQVMVDESQRNLQLIVWRDEQSEPLQVLRLNTVTYGTASAPFLSTRCLVQLGNECTDKTVANVILHDFYVDDLITTHNDKDELKRIIQGVIEKLAEGCFPLRKFRTNAPDVFDTHSTLNQNQDFCKESTVLGLNWSPSKDTLQFSCEFETVPEETKRTILSATCKTFDPLGLLSVCTIVPKLILQRLWLTKHSWDDPVPDDIKALWLEYKNSTQQFSDISIPRHALLKNPTNVELHCFTDASQRAYAACVYLKSMDDVGNVSVNLLCAKSKVAPLKPVTIPRLELCAALLGARLHAKVAQALRLTITRSVFWSDSTIVLSWIRTQPKILKTFVCNRIQEIRDLSDQFAWRHVPTDANPADLASRGIKCQDLNGNSLWWTGPAFLVHGEDAWPNMTSVEADIPEIKTKLNIQVDGSPPVIDFNKYSKLNKLQNIVAYVLRFINACKNKNKNLNNVLTVHELNLSLQVLTKLSQIDSFSNEVKALRENKKIKTRSSILSLNPFLDENGVLRVGGRLQSADCSYDQKHPMLLNGKHPLTKLIFEHEHLRLLHCGPQLLLSAVREQFWPTSGRIIARSTVHKCLTCIRMKGTTLQPIMGTLPKPRVVPSPPFETCGVDLAGPFSILSRKGRGAKVSKCYLCLFVCFFTKALHLEVVSDLSTNSFILSLRRFISRRGKPKTIYCDNGTNFVGANNELKRMLKASQEPVSNFACGNGIEFKFSPAYSPNFGGLWESGVKAAKFHLKRIVGTANLTFEELTTLFTQIEAILNSRPLTPMSSDPSDLSSLTPGHFLIGRPLASLPSPSTQKMTLNRYNHLEALRQHFWQRWSKEFLSDLQQRVKWRATGKEVKLGDLVILKEENLPPMKWSLGRVETLHPGPDGIARVVDVRTVKGTIRRAVSKLCPLPSFNDEEDQV